MSVADEWERIDRWLRQNAPTVWASLRDPLPRDHEGVEGLPAELLASLQVHNGQQGEVAFFEGFSLTSLSECLALRSFLAEVHAGDSGGLGWRDTWFPFLDDRCGSLVYVDAESGGVCTYLHDQPGRPVVTESLHALLAEIASAMEAGECAVEDLGVRLIDEKHPLACRLWD